MDTQINPIFVLTDKLNADIYVISGGIHRQLLQDITYILEINLNKRPNVALYLTTLGGDPDAAYLIAKLFKSHYEKFHLYISGYCKSAGTLIALGADEIAMSRIGEFGPLDVQLLKDDSLALYTSGLDIFNAINTIHEQTLKAFEQNFIAILSGGGGSITIRTAAHIATELAVGLFSPLMNQLDPIKIGEARRAINIALAYGTRLGATPEIIMRLIYNYPSHGHVIDYSEAKNIFTNVRQYDVVEDATEAQIQSSLMQMVGNECLREAHQQSIIVPLNAIGESTNTEKGDDNVT